ncbi:MAG: BON domain-containing protein [Planctomycetota bacterium]
MPPHQTATCHRRIPPTISALVLLAGIAAAPAAEDGLSDPQMADAVERVFSRDPAINASRIDVAVNEGVVSLTGEVTNILAKDRATHVAQAIRGVRSVSNRIEVQTPLTRSDHAIRGDVIMSLVRDRVSESFDIGVTVDDRVVTLTGSVQSWQESRFAERAAKEVKGVSAVENRIIIDYETERDDAEIRDEIVSRFRWDPLISRNQIDIDVDDGQVALSGAVTSDAERSRAFSKAWVTGVKAVDDADLVVTPGSERAVVRPSSQPYVTDANIEQAVEDAMLYDPRVYSFDIRVQADQGAVRLTGNVDSLRAKHAAEQLAEDTVGVTTVTNLVKVRTQTAVSDDEAEQAVVDALVRNPYTEAYEIDTRVNNGTVTLSGEVTTYFEKAEAERVASRAMGVQDVINAIQVDQSQEAYVYDPWVDPYDPYAPYLDAYAPDTPLLSDAEIADEIEGELYWSPFVEVDQIDVRVVNGVATLSGTVDSWSERSAAVTNAYEGGATLVVNDLAVASD